eukprot:g5409.t1
MLWLRLGREMRLSARRTRWQPRDEMRRSTRWRAGNEMRGWCTGHQADAVVSMRGVAFVLVQESWWRWPGNQIDGHAVITIRHSQCELVARAVCSWGCLV